MCYQGWEEKTLLSVYHVCTLSVMKSVYELYYTVTRYKRH